MFVVGITCVCARRRAEADILTNIFDTSGYPELDWMMGEDVSRARDKILCTR